jgi:hypothetical protein
MASGIAAIDFAIENTPIAPVMATAFNANPVAVKQANNPMTTTNPTVTPPATTPF